MLNDLVETETRIYRKLQTVDFIHYGLANTILQVYRPTEYVTHKSIKTSNSIENFGYYNIIVRAWIYIMLIIKLQ